MGNLYWIGPRESDIKYTNGIYKGSVTLFGDNSFGNKSFSHEHKKRMNHNIPSKAQGDFLCEEMLNIIGRDSNALFMFYNPGTAFFFKKEIASRTICLNDECILDTLNDKIRSRLWFSKCVPTLNSILLSGRECAYAKLQSFFPFAESFVLQSNSSSGGFGTHILREKTEKDVLSKLNPYHLLLVSPYIENSIPVNIHAIIYEDEILLFPPSLQIIIEDNSRLLYKGADFIAYKEISSSVNQRVYDYSYQLCKKLQHNDYRGVCGIDYLVSNDEVLFLEVNNRFQASTFLLNLALNESRLPSINELCIDAFNRKKSSYKINLDKVLYSNYAFTNDNSTDYKYLFHNSSDNKDVFELALDGFQDIDPSDKDAFEEDAFLFRIIFKTKIANITTDGKVSLIHNFLYPK